MRSTIEAVKRVQREYLIGEATGMELVDVLMNIRPGMVPEIVGFLSKESVELLRWQLDQYPDSEEHWKSTSFILTGSCVPEILASGHECELSSVQEVREVVEAYRRELPQSS